MPVLGRLYKSLLILLSTSSRQLGRASPLEEGRERPRGDGEEIWRGGLDLTQMETINRREG